MDYWKVKLNEILHSTQICGVCLSTDKNVSTLSDQFVIVAGERSYTRTLADMLNVVFIETVHLASSQICNSCIMKLIQSYIFIQQARDTLTVVNNFLSDLYKKTCYIHNKILNKDNDSSNPYNVIIALEKNNFIENIDNVEHDKEEKEMHETKKNISRKRKFKCVSCNIILPSYKAWRIHETTHKNKLKCKRCSKIFKSQKYLINHYKSHLSSRCKICRQIIQNGGLLSHLKEYHEPSSSTCSICKSVFNSVKDLAAHMHQCHYKEAGKSVKSDSTLELAQHQFSCTKCKETRCAHHKYLMYYREQLLNATVRAKCLDCQYICRTKEDLLEQVNTRHLNTYVCENCSKKFDSTSELCTHITNFHKNVHICQNCNMKFTNLRIYEKHIKACHETKKWVKDQRRVSLDTSKINVEPKTIRPKQDIYPCGLCNRIYLHDLARKKHMIQSHSGEQKKRVATLDCAVCQDKFSTKVDLSLHVKSHGPDVKYPCKMCNTQYETLRQFRAHNRKHIGPFAICEVCGKEMRQILLKKHMTTHSDPVVTCETCGKSFQNTTLLKYHQKMHLESVPCPKCEKLINPAKLRRHYKNHIIQENPALKAATKQTPNLKCKLCEYKTWNNVLLECHMNRHHLKVKPYICHVCSKAFIGKHLLKKHIDTHTVEKTIICMICMKKFANAACLKMHLRLHTGERPFTCEICGDRFRSSSILNVHKLKKHSDKNNLCPLCQNKFHTVRDLRRHIMKVHWKDKDKKFNPRELSGLGEEHYHLFHDGRRAKVDKEEVDSYFT